MCPHKFLLKDIFFLLFYNVWTSSPPHVPATAVKAHACVCKVARAVMCAYAGVSMKKGVADTNQTLISPERPPVRIYRVLLTAGPSRPPQHNVGCVSLAEGAETSRRMAPFFFIRTDRFCFNVRLPSPNPRRGATALAGAGTIQRL